MWLTREEEQAWIAAAAMIVLLPGALDAVRPSIPHWRLKAGGGVCRGWRPGTPTLAGTGNPAISGTNLGQRHRDQPGNGTMDPVTTLRKLGKLNYAAARLPLSLLDDHVARHWHEDAAARVGFERYLGTLDLLAGRLLADDAIRQRGRILWRFAG